MKRVALLLITVWLAMTGPGFASSIREASQKEPPLLLNLGLQDNLYTSLWRLQKELEKKTSQGYLQESLPKESRQRGNTPHSL